MKSFQLLRTVTSKGPRYYIDGRRVSLEEFQTVKTGPGKRQDCFITRATRHAVRDYSTLTIATAYPAFQLPRPPPAFAPGRGPFHTENANH